MPAHRNPNRKNPPRVKSALHRGDYHVTSRRITAAARANPHQRCWRCGRTLTQHPRHKSGAPPVWHAGHTGRGREMLPEGSTCNVNHGAWLGGQRMKAKATRDRTTRARRPAPPSVRRNTERTTIAW
jgi:hypothetical protein